MFMQLKKQSQKHAQSLKQDSKLPAGFPVRTNLRAGANPEVKDDDDVIEPFQNSVNLNIADPLAP